MIVPLEHGFLRKKVPGVARLLPVLYNHWYKSECLKLLRRRTKDEVEHAWRAAVVPNRVAGVVTRTVRDEYCWLPEALFVPADECFVVFCWWRLALSDGLEAEVCIVEIERELEVRIAEEVIRSLPTLKLGEFCRRFCNTLVGR
ncbi:MAG: hypothetical protein WBH86_04000 [Thermogutta sp.]